MYKHLRSLEHEHVYGEMLTHQATTMEMKTTHPGDLNTHLACYSYIFIFPSSVGSCLGAASDTELFAAGTESSAFNATRERAWTRPMARPDSLHSWDPGLIRTSYVAHCVLMHRLKCALTK